MGLLVSHPTIEGTPCGPTLTFAPPASGDMPRHALDLGNHGEGLVCQCNHRSADSSAHLLVASLRECPCTLKIPSDTLTDTLRYPRIPPKAYQPGRPCLPQQPPVKYCHPPPAACPLSQGTQPTPCSSLDCAFLRVARVAMTQGQGGPCTHD